MAIAHCRKKNHAALIDKIVKRRVGRTAQWFVGLAGFVFFIANMRIVMTEI
jgi:hypothetical protein